MAAQELQIEFEVVSSQDKETHFLIDPEDKSLTEATFYSLELKEKISNIESWNAENPPVYPIVVSRPEGG